MNESVAEQGRRVADAEREHLLARVDAHVRRGELLLAVDLAERAGMLKLAELVRQVGNIHRP